MMLSLQVGKANVEEQILAARLIPPGLMQLRGSRRQGRVTWRAQGQQATQCWSQGGNSADYPLVAKWEREGGRPGGLRAGPGMGCWMYNRGPENYVSRAPKKDPEPSFIKACRVKLRNGWATKTQVTGI